MKKIIRKLIFGIAEFVMPKKSILESNQLMAEAIDENKPMMAARFGAVEIKAVLYGICPLFSLCLKNYVYAHFGRNAGFFPMEELGIKRFSNMMLEAMKQVSLLMSWRPEEIFFYRQLHNSKRLSFDITLPSSCMHENAWTQQLKGKRVLIIHPFAETIEKQYVNHRCDIWEGRELLPRFASLKTIKAVQSIAGNNVSFSNWFDALAWMEKEIDKSDYEVALLGCGAYGFLLAHYIKQQGKKAIHIGGALQLFFGIKGKRWDNLGLYNEYWVSPSDSEKPQNFEKVEDGCYW